MTKQTILGRVSQLARTDVDALLDQAEDPHKMLDQLIRDYTGTVHEAEDALEVGLAELRRLEHDRAEDMAAAAEWGGRARTASRGAEELRTGGGTMEAERFDTLARIALAHQVRCEQDAAYAEPLIAVRSGTTEQLRIGLDRSKELLELLRTRRDELVARSRTSRARTTVLDAVRRVDLFDPAGDLGRFEDKLRRERARAGGREELAPSVLDEQFGSVDPYLGPLADPEEVDSRLAALKRGASASS
ncbi:PspA/IM30 family protein [Actinacidiphila acididurans]|uniref:PspA/IM30 family protein n=1 Tax=Actinacidiphila acididurans TaxID=2784346 RepID=A0ABS2TXG6_9ACTN|nr:PspA/IM30 family protein [Actinacidiphila acididurans]MBM9507777.1 PspA/IM30 family protein [Actinacidiphila acididurans]